MDFYGGRWQERRSVWWEYKKTLIFVAPLIASVLTLTVLYLRPRAPPPKCRLLKTEPSAPKASIAHDESLNTLIQSAGYVKFINEGPESAEDYMNLELSAVRLPRSEFEGTEVLEFDGCAIMPIKHRTTGNFVTIIRGSDWTFKTEQNVTTVCTPDIACSETT